MMAAETSTTKLIDRLPGVRGRLIEGASLAMLTWFRVGGPAEVLFRPADADDLAQFLAATPKDIPITVLGVGSNLLVRDGGVPGVVIRLGEPFAKLEVRGREIVSGAGVSNLKLANAARDAGMAGFEFLSGIPGSLGGSLRMNAGAYGAEIADVTLSVEALDRDGARHTIAGIEMGFSYRHSSVPEDLIFVSASLRGRTGNPVAIGERMMRIQTEREETQPIKTPTGGSTFVNPQGHKAWQLIDAAGCRGLTRGGAMVSEKHTNFLVNTGDATAADIEGLGEEVRRRVFAQSGVTLEWEIRRIGVSADAAPHLVDGGGAQ
ncbi:MAG: UDP-N-acetylenolpyruvoylglucosamine reductase [Rhodospirillales bacterium]|nr:UDP-N-acetylenolpyruvoylglucosamine reductase [Rhodospirillales bacterium]